ncbi:MOS1T transposase, partial [Pseudoatta argentina]
MIQKQGHWIPHELNKRQMERRKNTCEILFERYKRKSFLHRIVGDEKWIYFENPKRNKSWVTQAHHPHRLQDRIALAGRRCSVFGGTRRVWSIMSC